MRKKTAKARTDGQATRQALVDAAGILAARHGWASVRAKDVCKLAGVSAASVNYWFGSRDELYREVVRQIPAASGIWHYGHGKCLRDRRKNSFAWYVQAAPNM